MTDEVKNVEETTNSQEEETNEIDTELEDNQSAEEQDKNESTEDEQSEDEGINYKDEYERLIGENAKQNEHIYKQDKKILKLKQKKDIDDKEEEDEDINSLVKKSVNEQMSSFVEDTIEEEIGKVSSNEDEKKLIRWYFDNRIVKENLSKKSILDYIADAKLLANRNKNAIKNKVIEKTNKSQESAGKPNFTGTPPKKSNLKVTEYDKKMAERFFGGDIKKWIKFKPNNN